jgi:hypothetical protein
MGQGEPEVLPSVAAAAIREAKAVSSGGDVMRIGNIYRAPESQFMTLPDGLCADGTMVMNDFAALPVGATFRAETDAGEKSFTVSEIPSIRVGATRMIPRMGIVVRDYFTCWNEKRSRLPGVWIFCDNDGSIGRLVAIE